MEDRALFSQLDRSYTFLHRFYGHTTGADFHEDADCAWYTSAIGFPVFGGVVQPRFEEANSDERIEEIRAALHASGTPHCWFVGPSATPVDLKQRLEARGAESIVVLNGMSLEWNDLAPTPALPDGVEILPVQNERTLKEYARLFPLLFGAPVEGWIDNLVAAELEIFNSPDDSFHRYIAVEGGRTIAAGMTSQFEDAAVLQTLCTHPECRNRGIGAALATRGLLEEKDRGSTHGLVWAGTGADKLYRRMGFDYVATATVYSF